MRKTLGVLVVLAVLLVVGRQVYQKARFTEGSPGRRGASGVPVEVHPVKKATLRDRRVFAGSLLSGAEFTVAPKVAGRLEKLLVDVGDAVSNGQLVALLDDDEYARRVEEAQAELKVARANLQESRRALEIAGRQYERLGILREKELISHSEFDAAEAEYNAQVAAHEVARAKVAQMEAALKAAEVRLSYTKIHASWENGGGSRVVGERFVHEGEMLSPGDPIVSILDISSLTAVIHVTERNYYLVGKGLEVSVSTDALPERGFTGRVARIAPLLKEESRQARVEVDVPNEDGLLKPGMFVRVVVELESREGSVVPVRALTWRDGRQGVFSADLEGMTAGFVPVKLGIVSGDEAEVEEPPLSGWVVVMGQHLLKDGSSISLPQGVPGQGGSQGGPAPGR